MKTRILATVATLLMSGTGYAATVTPAITDYGVNTTTAQNTRLYRADMTGLGLSQISSITLTDSNSGVGGSGGAYSGFDLDAMFLDIDGDPYTLGDQFYASSFLFQAGSLRSASPASNTAGPTNGSSSATSVDEPFATLGAVDGVYFSTGSLTLGDGGVLTAIFSPDVLVGSSLYLFVGEVSGDPGEFVNASLKVSDTAPSVPLPAPALLLISGLGVLAFRRTKKAA